MNIYGNIRNNLKESNEYVADFDEIVTQMSNASDYEDLYAAASLIQDPSIRVDVEQCIEQCEEDGDDVDVAYSVTTSDYLDMYAMQGVENTPTAEADYRASLKKESENLDEAIEQKYRKSNESYNELLRNIKKYTGSYDYLYGGSVSTECYEYPVTIKYFYYNRPYAGFGYNLVVNVLTPMDSMAGGEIQEAIENAFEDNAKYPLSNSEIKEKILQTVKEVDAQNNLSEANLEPQYSTRKSFYGKANINDDNTLVSYGTPIMKIVDGKIQMLCRPEHLTQTTIRHIREFMQQNGMDPVPKNKLVKMIEEQGNINESEKAPWSHTAVIYYGTTDDQGDDTSEIELIVDNRDDYPDITDEQLDDTFENDNLDIWNNDLTGKEEMMDIESLDETFWLIYKGKDDHGKYHFIIDPSNINESEKESANKDAYNGLLQKINVAFKEITGNNLSKNNIYLLPEDNKKADKYTLCSKRYNIGVKGKDNSYIKALKNIGATNIKVNKSGNIEFNLADLNEGESSYSNKFSSFLNKNAEKLEKEYEKDTDNEAVVDPGAKETDYTKDFLDWVERKYKKEILNEAEENKKFILSINGKNPVEYNPEDMKLEDAKKDYLDNEGYGYNEEDIEVSYINESDGNNTPKQNKIPRNWKKISGEMVGDSSGGKAGDKFEITKDEYGRPIMKYEDGKEYQANWSMIRSPEMVKVTNIELNESENLKESSNVIWSSETTIDDLDPEEIKEQYDIYVENLDPDKEPMDYEDWEADWVYNSDMWDVKKEDLEENIYPMIDKQINNDILIVSGNYNSNYPDFRKSGNGGKFLNKAEDILDWLSNEDRIDILNNDGIVGIAAYDHDGSIGGLLYTLPDDDKLLLEIAKATDYYEVDATDDEILDEFKYDLTNGNIDMSNLKGYEDRFIPITVSW